MKLLRYAELVAEVREAQREYFRTRSESAKLEAMRAERRLDAETRAILRPTPSLPGIDGEAGDDARDRALDEVASAASAILANVQTPDGTTAPAEDRTRRLAVALANARALGAVR